MFPLQKFRRAGIFSAAAPPLRRALYNNAACAAKQELSDPDATGAELPPANGALRPPSPLTWA
jgi:hypothetical protein